MRECQIRPYLLVRGLSPIVAHARQAVVEVEPVRPGPAAQEVTGEVLMAEGGAGAAAAAAAAAALCA